MIGDKIKERRIELGLKQVEVSKATGIKITTLSNYENNDFISLSTIFKNK